VDSEEVRRERVNSVGDCEADIHKKAGENFNEGRGFVL